MMSPVQRAISQRHKHILIGVGVLVAGLWVLLVMYLLRESRNATTEVQPGAVAVTSAPTFNSNSTVTLSGSRPSATSLLHHKVSSTPMVYRSVTPNQSMGSTSTFHIHQTSSATPHSVGGGGSGSIGVLTTTSSSSNRGIQSTTASYTGAIYIPLATNAITAVGATTAEEVVNQKMGIIRRAKMTNDGEYPGGRPDPVPDEEDDPTPVGDVVWPLMVLLAAVYAFFCYRRRRARA